MAVLGELGGSGQPLSPAAVRGTGALNLNRDPAAEAVLGVLGVEGPCAIRGAGEGVIK
jgi:hypothetical protein